MRASMVKQRLRQHFPLCHGKAEMLKKQCFSAAFLMGFVQQVGREFVFRRDGLLGVKKL